MKTRSREKRHSNGATLTVFITAAILAMAGPLHADTDLTANSPILMGPIQVRFSFTDQGGNAQDLTSQQLPDYVYNSLPSGLLQLSSSALANSQASSNGYFDNLWTNTRDSVCKDVTAEISNQINSNGYQAYNINCQASPFGVLWAHILNSWEDDSSFTTITGTRLHVEYDVAFNAVSFSVRTPFTCQNSSLTCPQDPVYTVVFEVHLGVNADSVNESTLVLPPVTSHSGTVVVDAIKGGDHTQEIANDFKNMMTSITKAATQAAQTGGELALDALAQDVGGFLAQVLDVEIAAALNAHLHDTIAAMLNLSSSTAGTAALNAAKDFDTLFNDLELAHGTDFSTFTVSAGSDDSLIFRLTDPGPGKPEIHNKLADLNSQPSIILPSIGVSQPQVKQGDKIQVLGQFFPFAYPTHLVIDWNRTVFGNPTQSELRWGRQGGAVTDLNLPAGQFSFEADNLTPNTTYVFQVRECDPINCSPFSDPLLATTQAKGSDSAVFRLDSPNAPVIGTVPIGTDGTFSGFATIPLSTPVGSHSLGASAAGSGAVTAIFVCPASGCQPALAVVNPDNGTLDPPGAVVQMSAPVRLRGSSFAAGQTVTVTIDTLQGIQLGTTAVGSDGTFDVTFTMPSTATVGSHNLVAAQTGAGNTPLPGPVILPHALTAAGGAIETALPAGGTVTHVPPVQFATIVQASVNVFVTESGPR